MKLKIAHSRGFTLVELMIVMGIIGILMTMSLFPFGSYIDRNALRQEKNELTQEWILAHKSVRNGVQYEKDDTSTTDVDESKHAYILFEFKKGEREIKSFLVAKKEDSNTINTLEDLDLDQKKNHKTITLDRKIQVLDFKKSDGSPISSDMLYYLIEPPTGSGSFYF